MVAFIVVLIVVVIVALAFFLMTNQSEVEGFGEDYYADDEGWIRNDEWEYLEAPTPNGPYIPSKYIPPQPPPFVHTINSAVACGWLLAFLESASKVEGIKGGLFGLESVKQALGQSANTSPWSYAKESLEIATPATSVVIPALSTGALTTGTLITAPIASVVALFSVLGTLDNEIKKKIAEAEICLTFVHAFTEAYSMPPMGLLNMLSNLVPDSGKYGIIRGNGSAQNRSKEPGVGIIADMQKLFVALLQRGWLKGFKPLTNVAMLRKMMERGEVKAPLNNNVSRLKVTGRGFGYWPRYVYSTDYLFLQPWTPQWKKGFADVQYREALKECFERTGNPATFDKESMISWLEKGGVYNGKFKGYIQPSLFNFSLGHDPGKDGYNGLDTGFAGIPLANQTKPSFGESSWKLRFDFSTNEGWVLVP